MTEQSRPTGDILAFDPAPREPGFGVYVHWPFCAAKCPYCDFNSHVRHRPIDQARYAAAFERELTDAARRSAGQTVTSIFLGGGTPSLMEPATVARVLDAVAANWTIANGAEITLEANPSSVEAERFRGYRAAGVNRVSLGVQALNDRDLKLLGRLHDVEQALHAIGLAREIFPRLSFDLIYARPDQTVDAWEAELTRALDLAADHLSLYQLTIEEGTPFFALHKSGKLKVPDGELSAELYEATQRLTAARGLPAYEISNHAVPGAESRHNLTYWRYGLYAGVGPGAHGRLMGEDGRHAISNEPLPETWLKMVESWDSGAVVDDLLAPDEEADELLLMGLRLTEGIDLARWRRLSGRDIDANSEADLRAHGMVERLGPDRIRATPAGMLVLDAVVADLA
ncbi:radical SAM family heme chaperone HemW [Aurantimonas sp. C2-6-R+9]|uniref:radical SAM family heme chaperone HemW n=1 Tax=unclassified Aurantimonas TaxID=2638230 RepID=UPI002E17BE7C|nr:MULTISPECIES: radical SAM family heme chaperone HemW [unclassified Aurantimonas]MEC5292511.1 radical SAM family heme chaperone HemW [Aurantimonas sp. C2-3-R2]MEC5323833.1 radical SAM family heme chaperone HemW [Aurantimonas sp. A3-2-R12]MEC5382766.1 radical SAM family heme chaperone HemW [Aurantimonas sp. C2-6-R+9]MEC5413543.1 radical SAM family heme chaperone HemW [Aurantimonas sp. C2-4-R8]